MPRLTRKQERLLRHTANAVRMIVTVLTFFFAVKCLQVAEQKYNSRASYDPPEIPRLATWGNIAGIYLPLIAVVVAYVWATRPAPNRNLAPNGFAMALFRDAVTPVLLGGVMWLPYYMYAGKSTIQEVIPFLVWYQTVITALSGAAFTYYFHGRISTKRPEEADVTAADAAPRRRSPRRRKPAASALTAPDAAAAREPATTSAALEG